MSKASFKSFNDLIVTTSLINLSNESNKLELFLRENNIEVLPRKEIERDRLETTSVMSMTPKGY